MADANSPILNPDEGYELCYECDGKRVCWLCHGDQVLPNGERCGQCTGRGWCIVCGGAGQLRKVAPAGLPTEGKRVARSIGCFRDLGYERGPSVADLRGKRKPEHQARVVDYLRAGKVLVMSPGLVNDVFDKTVVAGKRSIRTDGEYAWPDSLAFFVERYQVELPADFEEHMAARGWVMPANIDVRGLVPG